MEKPINIQITRSLNNRVYAVYTRVQYNGDRYECRDCGTLLPLMTGNTSRFCSCCARLLLDIDVCEKDDPEMYAEAQAIFQYSVADAEKMVWEFLTTNAL